VPLLSFVGTKTKYYLAAAVSASIIVVLGLWTNWFGAFKQTVVPETQSSSVDTSAPPSSSTVIDVGTDGSVTTSTSTTQMTGIANTAVDALTSTLVDGSTITASIPARTVKVTILQGSFALIKSYADFGQEGGKSLGWYVAAHPAYDGTLWKVVG